MEILQEITDWHIPNHTYWVLSTGKLVAYQIQGTSEKIVLKNPMSFDRTRRRFILIGTEPNPAQLTEHSVVVQGSAGKTHTVTLGDNPACTCTGFRFRGNCKHLALAMSPSQQAAPEGSINH